MSSRRKSVYEKRKERQKKNEENSRGMRTRKFGVYNFFKNTEQ